MTDDKIPDSFTLNVNRYEDGGWYITSPEIPGMLLSNKELHKALAPLETVAQKLMERNS